MSIQCMSVDYRDFINRDLPLIERGCMSKAAFVSRREARSWVRDGRRSDGSLDPTTAVSADSGTLGTGAAAPARPAHVGLPPERG